ncbi:MAG: hypothetical protein ACFFCW_43095 [Candidatus Hodarchaeota archaeon]
MPIEVELVDSVCQWFKNKYYSKDRLLLIHEEVSGRGGRRPDILIVVSDLYKSYIDNVCMITVEIERLTKGAIHSPKHGLRQLRKYPGHFNYLTIPSTITKRRTFNEIKKRCLDQGAGLLIVEYNTNKVYCELTPKKKIPNRTLRTYPVALKRWIALRKSGDSYRRVSRRRIIERL